MKLLFLTTDDSTFWSHRLTLARVAKKGGADIVIMTRPGEHCSRLEKEGFRVIAWSISRKSLNPIRELRSFLQVLKTYRDERPDLVHHIALKPIFYGSFAARLCGFIPVVNTVTGFGPVFTRTNLVSKVLQNLLINILGLCFRAENGRVIVQNSDDRDLLLKKRIVAPENIVLIPGFGVDTEQFVPCPEPEGEFLVILPGRMLWEKGAYEFVEAARELRKRGVTARMVLVGARDPDNMGCVPERKLKEWVETGCVEWWGHQTDMPAVICKSHLVCLPSYREGLPKALLEAGACGRAIVTTNAPGCSYVVRHGENGLLVPIRDSHALAEAIQKLMQDNVRRQQMGVMGRKRVETEFSVERITRQTLDVYAALMNGKWRFDRTLVMEPLKYQPKGEI
jgi:glycosyltransferase involved in cell wall biosynthesis